MKKTGYAKKIKTQLCVTVLFFCVVWVFAQNSPELTFTSRTFSNGVLYTLSSTNAQKIGYKLYEPNSAAYAEGVLKNGESLFVLNGITAAAWAENDKAKTLPIVLYPQEQVPFLGIENAFISPAEGIWANKQSLVVDVPADYDVYYSFTVADPLVSGLAYDGPVFIDATGTTTVYIAVVAPNGQVYSKSITFTVIQDVMQMPLANDKPIIKCGPENPVSVPKSMSYYLGSGKSDFVSGAVISSVTKSDILRYVPLVIKNDGAFFRYVLQTGETNSNLKPLPSVTGIEITQWNYFAFTFNGAVNFSVDGEAWQRYKTPVYIDRTKTHTVFWSAQEYDNGKIQSLRLPPKPELTGIPKNSVTNKAVTIGISNENYILRYETSKYIGNFLQSILFDVLTGEEHVFNADLAVFYNGIKQGTLQAHFIIDKKAPSQPKIISPVSDFSQNPITLTFDSTDSLFVRILSKNTDLEMGKHPDFSGFDSEKNFNPEQYKEPVRFLPENMRTIDLSGNEKSAVLYLVQAFSRDASGNLSAVSSYTVCVDIYSIFVSSTAVPKTENGTGSPLDPYNSFTEAINTANKKKYARIITSGSFSQIPSIRLNTNCEIVSTGSTELQFSENSVFLVQNAILKVNNVAFIQQNPVRNSGASGYLRRMFFDVKNAQISFENSIIHASGGESYALINAENANVTLKSVEITVSAYSYCTVVQAFDSIVLCESAKITAAATAVDMFVVNGGQLAIKKSDCVVTAETGRVADVKNAAYVVDESSKLQVK